MHCRRWNAEIPSVSVPRLGRTLREGEKREMGSRGELGKRKGRRDPSAHAEGPTPYNQDPFTTKKVKKTEPICETPHEKTHGPAGVYRKTKRKWSNIMETLTRSI